MTHVGCGEARTASAVGGGGRCGLRLAPLLSLLVLLTFAAAATVANSGALPSSIDLSSGVSGGTRVVGAQASDQLAGRYFSAYSSTSHPMASGDINGDGYEDIIVGAPEAGSSSAGAVYVIYGSPSSGGTIDLSAAAPNLTILGAHSADKLGMAVAVGDVNGDGIDDLLIGAPSRDNPADPGGGTNHGAVYVIYGSRSLPKTIDLATSSADVTVYGKDSAGRLGAGLASADVNGDGFDDVLAGARRRSSRAGWR